eukprot:4068778-Pyramimonas_sp.AAC.1
MRLRAQIAALSGARYEGGCATTAINLMLGSDQDPLVFGRLRVFRMWYDLLPSMLEQSARPLALAWKKAWQ